MYGKIFASLYQGSLRGCAHEILVFTNMIASSDARGCCDKHHRAIADEVGLTVDEVRAAIATLESPDRDSRSVESEGRRIVRLDGHRDWGWGIVNHSKYRAIRNEDDRRESNRLAQQRHRSVIAVSALSSMSAQAEAEAEADVITLSEHSHCSAPGKNTPAQSRKVKRIDSIAWSQEVGWTGISDSDRSAWSVAYPSADLTRELEKANQWLASNPTKAARRLWRRFVTNWLSRVSENGGSRQGASAAFSRNESHIPDDCADNQRHLWWMPDGRTPRRIPIYTTRDGRERYLDGTYA